MNSRKHVGTPGMLGTGLLFCAEPMSPSITKTVGTLGTESVVPNIPTNDLDAGDFAKANKISDVPNVPTVPTTGTAKRLNEFLGRWAQPQPGQAVAETKAPADLGKPARRKLLRAERPAEAGESPDLREVSSLLAAAYRRYSNVPRVPVDRTLESPLGGVALSGASSVHGDGQLHAN
jgi:hypothetical protein